MRNFDFNSIKNYDSIGMNVAFRHWHRINWYPTYYICMDNVMVETHKDNIYELVTEFSDRIKLFFLRKRILEFYPDLETYPQVLFLEDYIVSPYFFQITITTGAHASLFAAMLGYRVIYLLGIDLNMVERINESRSVKGIVLEITETPKNNPNYFIDDYQRKGERYNLPNPRPNLHYNSWVESKKILEKYGVDVINCNDKSKLDIFDFMDMPI